GDRAATARAVGVEGGIEVLQRELAPLEPRPGARGTRRDHHAVDEAGRDPVLALVRRDRVERRADDHAPHVEDDGPVVRGGPAHAPPLEKPVTVICRGGTPASMRRCTCPTTLSTYRSVSVPFGRCSLITVSPRAARASRMAAYS